MIHASDRTTQRDLETGGAILSLRQRGYRWTDIVEALDLGDEHEARKLAGRYLLAATAAERARAQGREPAPVEYPEAERKPWLR